MYKCRNIYPLNMVVNKNLSKVEKEINWLSIEKQYYKMRKNALFQL